MIKELKVVAENEKEVDVLVEKAIHQTLYELFQKIYDDHGIRIDSVGTEWTDFVSMEGKRYVVIDLLSMKIATRKS